MVMHESVDWLMLIRPVVVEYRVTLYKGYQTEVFYRELLHSDITC